jgi:hypothetical protein
LFAPQTKRVGLCNHHVSALVGSKAFVLVHAPVKKILHSCIRFVRGANNDFAGANTGAMRLFEEAGGDWDAVNCDISGDFPLMFSAFR